MAFKRKVELKISKQNELTGLLISGLDISFDFERSTSPTPNVCKINVHNANADTRSKLLQKDSNVILNAGYEDEVVGTIFIGRVTEVKETKQPPDIITHLEVSNAPLVLETDKLKLVKGEKDPNAGKFKTLFLSYKRGTNFKEIIRDVGTAMNTATFGLDQIDFVVPPSGYYFVGTPSAAFKNVIQVLESHGFSMYQDGDEIIVYQTGTQYTDAKSTYLSPQNGLLSAKKAPDSIIKYKGADTRDIIEFTSLLNPRIQPNGVIVIDKVSKSINGAYIVDKVVFKGDNFGGGEYTTKGIASATLIKRKRKKKKRAS